MLTSMKANLLESSASRICTPMVPSFNSQKKTVLSSKRQCLLLLSSKECIPLTDLKKLGHVLL